MCIQSFPVQIVMSRRDALLFYVESAGLKGCLHETEREGTASQKLPCTTQTHVPQAHMVFGTICRSMAVACRGTML